MLRVVNFLKIISIVIFLTTLLFVYAYLPIMVKLRPDTSELILHKEHFFYFSITIFVIVNVALLAFQKIYEKNIRSLNVKAWVRGLTFVINLYLAFLIGFIGVINNTGQLDPEGWAYLNYLGPFLLILWIGGFIFLVIRRD